MGEIEGTYPVLQTAGTRLGVQTPMGVSTLEPGQILSPRVQEKHARVRVKLLDNTVEIFDIEPKCDGQVLLTQLWKHLNLIECDYFGLEFQNIQSYWIWLEPMKPVIKQIRRPKNAVLRLAVKFFPPDPGQLQEEYTRYLFALQLKRDLLEERLTCAATTAALLTSHLLQAEIGDYDETLDREHLKANVYLPSQEQAFEKILAFHRRHTGQTPAESDFQVLEIARKLEMYGIRFHTASDREGTKINLAVSHMGVLVFQGTTKINTFNWSKVRKLSFKRKRFLIKLHPEVHGPYQDTLEFLLGSRDECKNFWKICVEYHTFFRLLDQPKPKAKAVFFSRGSSFRYSGRTQKQLVDYIKDGGMKRIPYERWHSKTRSSIHVLTADLPKQVALAPPELASSPLLSPVLSDAGGPRTEDQEELRHKHMPEDEAYFIAKEILATERTYLKDLEVITVWFRSAVVKEDAMPAALMTLLFSNIDPVYEFHRGFLHEVEHRLAVWEGLSIAHTKDDHQRIGDILLKNMRQLKDFTSYFQRHDKVLAELEKATKHGTKLEAVYKEFELQKVCYLPLNTFLLKPIQRLVHYRLLLSRLCRHYTPGHHDYADCVNALETITEVTTTLQHSLIQLENLQRLMELQRDLVGVENLIAPGREFIREGCLHKLTKKGLQQRMFFLFSDMLLYTSKGIMGSSHFRFRGLLPLRGMLVEESENEWPAPHCFTIYAAQKTIVVAASTRQEKEKWVLDLSTAIQAAKSSSGGDVSPGLPGSPLCMRSPRSSDEVVLEQEPGDPTQGPGGSLEGLGQHRANTTIHVCWYRNTSVSRADHSAAVENQLSGYLLRKFKNTNGWQKLWVVFTNFCLFFYKTHQDDHPLASLPLLGYSVSVPREADGIHKDYVFKLQFKSHVYFFQAESKYTFKRWMEVIESASSSCGAPSPAQDSPWPCSGLEGALKGKEE
ncbi:FERM, RhoGEF and pleckstrin domain-containing protein 2 isoform X6 [Heterocephalus glaber]|uniref:FERM, ARHGEF and pleckstrin domain-containing protein 2 n=1 Tax=Heterocephalus glaber TaxID=10181 RepID=A0AAX6S0J7_HETGA|nr:FERM, RhoGEF and pleckstrin domain-containing protein 2 isoform X6 [Heterocephalus glaber]